MSTQNLNSRTNVSPPRARSRIGLLLAVLAGAIGYLLAASPGMEGARRAMVGLLSLDSVQRMWFITRAAGLTGYVLLWLSTVWGLVVSAKFLDPVLHRTVSYDFHEFLSLLAIGFVALHILVLLADQYLPFNLAQILIPFVAPYRPLWVGVGVIGFYLTILVTVTFYLRARIGPRVFRAIHYASFLAFLAAAVHGLLAGTDSSLLTTQLLYAGTLLSVVFLTTYWVALGVQRRWDPERTLNTRLPD